MKILSFVEAKIDFPDEDLPEENLKKIKEDSSNVLNEIKKILNDVDNSFGVFCVVSSVAKTGVEMEAIMGVNAALVTIYDLSKIVNPHLKIDNVKLLIKEGGKSGLWTNPDGLPKFLENIF